MKIAIRHDAVAETVARLALSVRCLEDELATLESEVSRLRASWDGSAQRAYAQAHTQWKAAIVEMKAMLAEATRRLMVVNSISMTTASAAARVWA